LCASAEDASMEVWNSVRAMKIAMSCAARG